METMDILDEFCRINDRCRKVGESIIKQNPMQYEEEYGNSLAAWTDGNLLDFFIYKMGFYKMFSLGNVMSRYNAFYQYCADQGYIKRNPFYKSLYLTYDFLVKEIVEAGNVPFYTKEYLETVWNGQGGNAPYFQSVILSLFEGIRNYRELSVLKYCDVDFKNKVIHFKGMKLNLSDDLLAAYRRLHEMEYYFQGNPDKGGVKGVFDDSEGLLIRRIMANGRATISANVLANKNNIAVKMKNLNLSATGIYDSGLMHRLAKVIGEEVLLEYLVGDEIPKALQISYNKKLEEVFRKEEMKKTVKNFNYDYRVYAYCMKYKKIKV